MNFLTVTRVGRARVISADVESSGLVIHSDTGDIGSGAYGGSLVQAIKSTQRYCAAAQAVNDWIAEPGEPATNRTPATTRPRWSLAGVYACGYLVAVAYVSVVWMAVALAAWRSTGGW